MYSLLFYHTRLLSRMPSLCMDSSTADGRLLMDANLFCSKKWCQYRKPRIHQSSVAPLDRLNCSQSRVFHQKWLVNSERLGHLSPDHICASQTLSLFKARVAQQYQVFLHVLFFGKVCQMLVCQNCFPIRAGLLIAHSNA